MEALIDEAPAFRSCRSCAPPGSADTARSTGRWRHSPRAADYCPETCDPGARPALRLSTLGFRLLGARHLPDAGRSDAQRPPRKPAKYCRLAAWSMAARLTWIARARGSRPACAASRRWAARSCCHATATGKAWLARRCPKTRRCATSSRARFPTAPPRGSGDFRQGRRASDRRAPRAPQGNAASRLRHSPSKKRGPASVAMAAAFRASEDPDAPDRRHRRRRRSAHPGSDPRGADRIARHCSPSRRTTSRRCPAAAPASGGRRPRRRSARANAPKTAGCAGRTPMSDVPRQPRIERNFDACRCRSARRRWPPPYVTRDRVSADPLSDRDVLRILLLRMA